MKPIRRLTAACAALVALALLGASVPHASLEEEKARALQTVLDGTRSPADRDRVLEAAASANALTAIYGGREAEGGLAIDLAATPDWEAILIDNDRKLVLDFANTVALDAEMAGLAESHPLLKSVRYSQFSLRPLTARVVLEFIAAVEFEKESVREGKSLLKIAPRRAQDADLPGIGVTVNHPVAAVAANVDQLAAQLAGIQRTHGNPGAPGPDRQAETEAAVADMADQLAALRSAAATSATRREIDRIAFELQAVSAPKIELFRSVVAMDAAQEAVEPLEPINGFEGEVMLEDAEDVIGFEGEDTEADPLAEEAPVPLEEEEDFQIGFDEDDIPPPPGPRVAPTPQTIEANEALHLQRTVLDAPQQQVTPVRAADTPAPSQPRAYTGDPMERRVNLDFRQMDLANVVALLGHMAGINIIAGTDISGTVTANFKDVPLRQAMQTVLRINGLGMLEEENIYRIVPYDEAVAANRVSTMVTLNNAKARDVGRVLTDVLRGARDQRQFNISADQSANIVIITGPEGRVDDLVAMAHQLDVAEPVLPTITEPIKLNYASPSDVIQTVEKMLTPQIGQIGADERSRHVVVTDAPVVVEQVRALIKQIDTPVKQVAIDAMVVDVTLQDEASTGVDWLMEAVRRQSRRSASLGGPNVGNLQELGLGTNLGLGPAAAGLLSFNVLTDDLDWRGIIQAEVRNFNGELVSNPVLVTVENKPAKIEIVREIPYIELTQTAQGGSQTSTEFKEIGTILEVTPRVTHDNDIVAEMQVKESDISGEFNGIPIEDKREIQTTLRLQNGQTIFTGGLRKNGKGTTVRKVPVLGDVPVVNFLFRSTIKDDRVNELLIFMTCRVVNHDDSLTPHLKGKLQGASEFELKTDAFNEIVHETIYPGQQTDPVWKFRRAD